MERQFNPEALQAACAKHAESVCAQRGEDSPDVEQAFALAFMHQAMGFAEEMLKVGANATLVTSCVCLLYDQDGYDETKNALEWFYHSVLTMLTLADPKVLNHDSRLAAEAIKNGLANAYQSGKGEHK